MKKLSEKTTGTKTVEANISNALGLFKASKDSAMEAAACAYLVHRAIDADEGLTKWLERKIADRNAVIDQHNEAETDERNRRIKVAKAIDVAEVDRESLGLELKEWRLSLKTRVEAKAGASVCLTFRLI